MSGDTIGAVITFCALMMTFISVLGASGMYAKDGPFAHLFRDIRNGLVSAWMLLRNTLWALAHRPKPAPRKPYLSADQIEELEIECYIGPYAEPFRADSLKARGALRRKRDAIRVVPPCERGSDGAEHLFAMNGRCA